MKTITSTPARWCVIPFLSITEHFVQYITKRSGSAVCVISTPSLTFIPAPTGRTSNRAASEEEIAGIMATDTGTDQELSLARDLFTFSFLCGGGDFRGQGEGCGLRVPDSRHQ